MAYRKWTYFEQTLYLFYCWVKWKLGIEDYSPPETPPESAPDDE